MVHVSETCEPTEPHLLTQVHTTPATVHEAQCTAPIQQALIDKDLAPGEHLVDAAYISSELLVHSRDDQGILLRGPTRPSQGWQTQVQGAYPYSDTCRTYASNVRIYRYVNGIFPSSLATATP